MNKIIIALTFITSLSLYSQHADEYYSLGNNKYLLKNYKDALKDYNKAIELQPNFAKAYYSRALVETILPNGFMRFKRV